MFLGPGVCLNSWEGISNSLRYAYLLIMKRICYILSIFLIFNFQSFSQLALTVNISSSPNPVGSGARALGQGNAFIAVADDATAASWNPAGIAQLERPEISFALESISRKQRISSPEHPESEGSDSLSLEDFNYASVVFPFFYKRNMVFSINYLKLFSFDNKTKFSFLEDSAALVFDSKFNFKQEGEFSVVAPAISIEVTPQLDIGITFNIWNHSITNNSRYVEEQVIIQDTFLLGIFPGPSITDSSKEEFEVEEGYSFVLGSLFRLNEEWTIAGVIKPPYKLDIDHSFRNVSVTQNNGITFPPSITSIDFNSELHQPLILGLGTAWRPTDPITVSADVTWTDWSKYFFREDGRDLNPVTGRLRSIDELEDTFTVRLGSEYLFILENMIVPIRAGIGYDPSPAVENVDDFYTLSLGVGIQLFNRINFDMAYEYRFGTDIKGAANLPGRGASLDVDRHRGLASLICYF